MRTTIVIYHAPKVASGFTTVLRHFTKGSLGYLSSMYFSTSLVLGEVDVPFPEIETRESRTET